MASSWENTGAQSGDSDADGSDELIIDVDGGDGAMDGAHHSPIMKDTSTAPAAAAPVAGEAHEPHPSSCSTLTMDTGTTAAREGAAAAAAARETGAATAGAAGAAGAALDPEGPERVSGPSQVIIFTDGCAI